EARAQPLDQVGLEQQRLGLAVGRDELQRRGRRDHAGDAAVVPGRPRIGDDALFQAFCLADIEHLAGGADHAVDAGAVRRELGVARDHGAPCPERARRELLALAGLLRRVGQRRLVLLLVGEVELGLDVLLGVVHGLRSRAPRRQTQADYCAALIDLVRKRGPLFGIMRYSSSTASAVRQARCWPPSTAMVTPVTLVAPAR